MKGLILIRLKLYDNDIDLSDNDVILSDNFFVVFCMTLNRQEFIFQ